MASFVNDLKDANRRLTIMQLLQGDPGQFVPVKIIRDGIASMNMLHNVSLDQIRDDVRWLERRLLVDIEIDNQTGTVYAKLLERGDEVAAGRVSVEGVDRPDLG